jgi:hypothetical protein
VPTLMRDGDGFRVEGSSQAAALFRLRGRGLPEGV